MIYRCNSTCISYNGDSGALFMLGFMRTIFDNTNTIISVSDITDTLSNSSNDTNANTASPQ